jgi:hypothetical protein
VQDVVTARFRIRARATDAARAADLGMAPTPEPTDHPSADLSLARTGR